MPRREDVPGLRADARRNRRLIVDAAREAFIHEGADARLEAIARRAGVGIATLYRHFPDRESLIRQVVIDNTREMLTEAQEAAAEEETAWDALARFATRVVERRLGLLRPVLSGRLRPDSELRKIQGPLLATLEDLVARAQRDGDLRDDVGLGDIQMLITLISRPIQSIPRELTDHMARRYLRLVLEGLHHTDGPVLPMPLVTAAAVDRLSFPDEPPHSPSPR